MLEAVRTRFESMEARKSDILRRVHALSPEEQEAPPKLGEWSPREIVQHLLMVEEETTKPLPEGSAVKKPLVTLAPLLVRFLRTGRQIPAPPGMTTPDKVDPLPLAILEAQWEGKRVELRARLAVLENEEAAGTPFTVHPILGPLDALQILDITDAHLIYHQKQFDRLGIR
jgi:hypothetical protein